MTEWKLTPADKDRLLLLAESADGKNKAQIEETAKKSTLTVEDLTGIKNQLPSNAPVFAFFNKLTVHYEQAEYKASAAFRAKTEKLRMKQENQQYRRIVESVDPSQKYGKENYMEDFGKEMKTVNRQLMSVFNVLITVVGAFFFGFSGVGYAYPHLKLDLATRFLIGLILGTIVFFADLYFVLKNLDEEIPDDEKSPFANSHNLNFKEVVKTGRDKKND